MNWVFYFPQRRGNKRSDAQRIYDNHFEFEFSPDETKTLFVDALPTLILSHNPLNFDKFDDKTEIFMLAGDTHDGQIPLPSWLWKILGYEKNARFNEGLIQAGRKKMYLSRGIGTSQLPIRLFWRPELVVLHFYV